MGSKGDNTRQRMIDATAQALEQNGYIATGINEIIHISDVPKGSLYFHFPGGKEELACLALEQSGREFSMIFQEILSKSNSPTDATKKIFLALERRVVESNYKKGCPIVISALESMQIHTSLQATCMKIYNGWIEGFEKFFQIHGYSKKQGHDLSVSLFSLWEGALLLAKLQKSNLPLKSVSKTALLLLSSIPNKSIEL